MAEFGHFDLSKLSVSEPGAIKLAFRELGIEATADQVREYARERHCRDVSEKWIENIRVMWSKGLSES